MLIYANSESVRRRVGRNLIKLQKVVNNNKTPKRTEAEQKGLCKPWKHGDGSRKQPKRHE